MKTKETDNMATNSIREERQEVYRERKNVEHHVPVSSTLNEATQISNKLTPTQGTREFSKFVFCI